MAIQPPTPRPVVDTPQVRALCEKVVPGRVPVLVPVDAPPWAKPDDCTANVDSVIDVHGGSVEYGWQLWETLPGLMLEAEFHAVWVDEEGNRLDVTPKPIPNITHSVFLPDDSLQYEGRQIDNVRVPLKDDPLIRDFIAAAQEFFEITNRDELADYHGELVLTPEMKRILQRRQKLEVDILKKYYANS